MKYVGVKATHDGAIACIEHGRLQFSYELEKFDNNYRHAKFASKAELIKALWQYTGVPHKTLLAIDGWDAAPKNMPDLGLAPYHEFQTQNTDDQYPLIYRTDSLNGVKYISHTHITNHLFSAYCYSPYVGQLCNVIVYDGGIEPRLYTMRLAEGKLAHIEFHDTLHEFYGLIYNVFGLYFGPYKHQTDGKKLVPTGVDAATMMAIPGKLMGYAGLGKVQPPIWQEMDIIYEALRHRIRAHRIAVGGNALGYACDGLMEHQFCRALRTYPTLAKYSDADFVETFQFWMAEKLARATAERVADKDMPLLVVGGCALNIGANSLLRRYFQHIWIPPWPNDSGSAIGAATTAYCLQTGNCAVEWSVYSGQPAMTGFLRMHDWSHERKDAIALGHWLGRHKDKVVIAIFGDAELGPRALGRRSMLASPIKEEMRDFLNRIKKREDFRPVAPICLEDKAAEWFAPGTPDPFMLFTHVASTRCKTHAPAIVHADGTARLQTISPNDCATVYGIVRGHRQATNVPIICNTSANYNGKGFFTCIRDAEEWIETLGLNNEDRKRIAIWDGQTLYSRN